MIASGVPAHPTGPMPRPALAAMALLMLVGGLFRFHDLGALGFWGPEDYVVYAARGILAHGVPELPSGALYTRALPYSYATAGVVELLGEGAASVRLASALLSTLSIGLVYLLARRTFGAGVALIAALVLALCDWEIMTGRTARMYAPFSCLVLAALWCLYEATFRRDDRFRIPCLIAMAMAGLLHRTALLLGLPLALLLVLPRRDVRTRGLVLLSLATLLPAVSLTFVLGQSPVARWNRPAPEARGTAVAAVGVEAPDVDASPAETDSGSGVSAGDSSRGTSPRRVGAGLLALGATLLVRVAAGAGSWLPPAALLAGAALVFQQGWTACYVFAGFLGLFLLCPGRVRRAEVLALGALVAAGCAAWVVVGVALDALSVREAARELSRYPRNFLLFYLLRSPAMFVVASVAGLEILRSQLRTAQHPARVLVLAMLVLPPLVMGFHPDAMARFYERYVFFLNPYFTVIYAWGVWWASGRAVELLRARGHFTAGTGAFRGALVAVLLLVTGGIQPASSVAAATAHFGANLQLRDSRGKPWVFADHAEPARFVCDRASARDRVIVTDVLGHYLYCSRVDYQFTAEPRNTDADQWIGTARNLKSLAEALAVLDAADPEKVWFVVSHDEFVRREKKGRLAELEALTAVDCVRREHLARDGISAVYAWEGPCLQAIRASVLALPSDS